MTSDRLFDGHSFRLLSLLFLSFVLQFSDTVLMEGVFIW